MSSGTDTGSAGNPGNAGNQGTGSDPSDTTTPDIPSQTTSTTISSSTTSPTIPSSITSNEASTTTGANVHPSSAAQGSTSSSGQEVSGNSGSSVSTGALAGGIIGALIAGIVLGIVAGLIWTTFRRRRRGRSRPTLEKRMSFGKKPIATSRAVDGDSDEGSSAWQVHLPQPVDDSSLRRSVKTLYHQIDLHVENFYVESGAGNAPEHIAGDSRLQQFETNLLPSSLQDALGGAQSKKAVIKHCLTYLILTRIDPECPTQYSFLAPEIGALPYALAGAQGAAAQQQRKKQKRVLDEAYAQYRVLTGYLLDITPHPTNPSTNNTAFHNTAVRFEAAFAPWISSATEAQTTNLTGIMRHAADLGGLLAVQPCLFRFSWSKSDGVTGQAGDARSFQIAPALYKLTDAMGRRLPQSQVMVEPVLR